MKLCILGVGVCLLASRELSAQSGPNSSTALKSLIYQFGLERPNQPVHSAASQRDNGLVVSLQRLQHAVSKRALQLSKKGLQAYFHGQYTQALRYAQEAVAIDPRSSMLENNLGAIYSWLGEDKKAQEAFEQAVAADSSAAVSYANLASVSFNLQQYREAETSARQALRLNPLLPEASLMLGLAQVAQNHWTREARRCLEEHRAEFKQAELVLKHWPAPERAVEVKSAGAGASAEPSGR